MNDQINKVAIVVTHTNGRGGTFHTSFALEHGTPKVIDFLYEAADALATATFQTAEEAKTAEASNDFDSFASEAGKAKRTWDNYLLLHSVAERLQEQMEAEEAEEAARAEATTESEAA